MAENPDIDWKTNSDAYELIGSSGPLFKNTERDWLMANSSARKAGVDVDLLQRSAEWIQRRVKTENSMGHSALFLATGKRVEYYKKDLDCRFGC